MPFYSFGEYLAVLQGGVSIICVIHWGQNYKHLGEYDSCTRVLLFGEQSTSPKMCFNDAIPSIGKLQIVVEIPPPPCDEISHVNILSAKKTND